MIPGIDFPGAKLPEELKRYRPDLVRARQHVSDGVEFICLIVGQDTDLGCWLGEQLEQSAALGSRHNSTLDGWRINKGHPDNPKAVQAARLAWIAHLLKD